MIRLTKVVRNFILLLSLFSFFLFQTKAYALTEETLSDCNWLVTYKGKTYDLAPLTRAALSRPIDTDLRYILERVPESNKHLKQVDYKLKEAKFHTFMASIFISGFLVSRILQSRQKSENNRRDYDVPNYATAGLFLASAVSSWKATSRAKKELFLSVEEFNRVSKTKILPHDASESNLGGFPDAKEN
ncbi:MAG: hypothetical protein M9962_06835 [Oligoflexia bacterium]|nr:hypothetical protein [Oligoflexia bacterium]